MAIKLEYWDGSVWQSLASETYVNTAAMNLTIAGSNLLSVSGLPKTKTSASNLTELQSLDSLRKKDIFEKDYLDRILKLDIYSYAQKSAKPKKLTEHALNHIHVGPLYDDVARLFNGNALSHPKAREGFVCNLKNCPQCHPDFKEINLAEILSYLILGFQSFYHKEYLPLKSLISNERKN